ncbi:MAG: glycosyltransferase family 2 protein [Bdellovibrionales bacterium]|nr:glycosyltransferase family 2 protein [Bdellovibrionales bacterium]
MEKTPVSLVIITHNEEQNIERCIQSVPFAADIVVLDSGSTDRTVDIARRLGARVRIEPWRGFQKQKTRAMALALHDWIVSLDADEALSEEAAKEIQTLLDANSMDKDGYELPRITYHLGRWIRNGGWYPDRQLRFFHREKCKWTETEVHERVTGDNIGRLKGAILHWSFNDLADQIETINRYSGLMAQEWDNKGKSYSSIKLVTKPIGKFIEKFFVKGGYKDGVPGLIIAIASSFAVFLRFAKLWERKHMKADDPVRPK